MKFTILDTVRFTSKDGKPCVKAACKAMSRKGSPFLFLAIVPEELDGLQGEECSLTVVFNRGGDAFVLPY